MSGKYKIDLDRYKKIIDEDFKTFPVNKRFFQLEEAWIAQISHRIMPKDNYFVHNDRKELRKELLKYLISKKYEYQRAQRKLITP
ncbi:hypothetical protein LCGC14_1953070 [marine sediment metagenome]|uniref:Uncharacterized protein n=1 Tax=marine sediment metagenome TaxID=412755 RepID=A0A0F9HV80_9ZZZZ